MAELLALALAIGSPPTEPTHPDWWGGRLYTDTTLHLGVRPHGFLDNEDNGARDWGVAITVQITAQVL